MDFRQIFPSDLPQLRRRWWLLVACATGPVVLAAWVVDSAQFVVVLPAIAVLSLMLLGLGVDAWLSRRTQITQDNALALFSGGPARADHLLDPVSGALNRAALEDLLKGLSTRSDQSKAAVSMIMIDIDGFKAINDHHGHPAGDAVLRACAARWRAMLRKSDWLCRYGGDEFCVLLPDTLFRQAEIVANKLMQAARDPILVTDHSHRSVEVQLTVSMGVSATEMFEPAHSTTLLIAADRMLYQSKAAGGNQITSVSGQEEIHGQ